MLRKTLGFVIFIIAVFFQIGIENIFNFFDKQVFAFIAASSLGLFIVNYRHGMDRTFLLKKLKKYIIFSSVLALLIQIMNFAFLYSLSLKGFEAMDRNFLLHIVSPFFWGYALSVLVEILIIED